MNKGKDKIVTDKDLYKNIKFYDTDWFMWVMLVLFAPVGVYFMYKNKKLNKILRLSFSILFLFIFFVIIKAFLTPVDSKYSNKNINISSSSKPQNKVLDLKDNNKYTYAQFLNIKMGTNYEQIKSILGEGTESASTVINNIKSVTYQWKNEDGSIIQIIFLGNKSVSKAQTSFKNDRSDISMSKYNEINNGMKYNDVKNILGEGTLMFESNISDILTDTYKWSNTDGSAINVTFQGDKVNAKSQLNLK